MMEVNDIQLLLRKVSMPGENVVDSVSLDSQKLQLSHVENISELYPSAHILIGGDLNVDFTWRSAHSQSLSEYLRNSSLIHCSQMEDYCMNYKHNFDNTRFSILDHSILSPALASSLGMFIQVEHDIDSASDHDPIFIKSPLSVELLCTCRPDRKFAWFKCDDNKVLEY
jgi:Endonuclease-reverse transcriptase